MPPRSRALVFFCLVLAACGSGGGGPPQGGADGGLADGGVAQPLAPELGTGDGTPGSVTFTEIATSANRISQPRDLAFNPRRPNELWVVNYATDSVVIVHDAPSEERRPEYRRDAYGVHFMAEVTALAFGRDRTSTEPIPTGTDGKPGTFATCGESRNHYNHQAPPNDFMGPALWSSDLDVFARYDPTGLGSHLDMLHCSPLCMGIAHDNDNVYWAFAGMSRTCTGTSCTTMPQVGTASIVRYDFGEDHGVGNDDHSDGTALQYATGAVKYVEGVPSHLVLDSSDGMLYVADTGNSRIARLDTASGRQGRNLRPMEPMVLYKIVDDAVITDVVSAESGELVQPAGIELHNGLLYVTDHDTSFITAFTRDGEKVRALDTGLPAGSLGGLTMGPDGKLYFVDMKGNRVLRIDP